MWALPDPSACAGLLCAASACRGCQSRPRGPCSSCNVSSQLVSFTPSLIQTWLWMALGDSSPEEGSPWVWTRRKGLPKCLEVPHHKERAGAAFSNDKSMSPSRKAQMKFGYSLICKEVMNSAITCQRSQERWDTDPSLLDSSGLQSCLHSAGILRSSYPAHIQKWDDFNSRLAAPT